MSKLCFWCFGSILGVLPLFSNYEKDECILLLRDLKTCRKYLSCQRIMLLTIGEMWEWLWEGTLVSTIKKVYGERG